MEPMRRCPDPDKEVAAARKAKAIFISNMKEIQTEQISLLQHEQKTQYNQEERIRFILAIKINWQTLQEYIENLIASN